MKTVVIRKNNLNKQRISFQIKVDTLEPMTYIQNAITASFNYLEFVICELAILK